MRTYNLFIEIMNRKESTFIFFMLFALMVISCDQRDPQAEYEILRDTVYGSPQEGEAAAQQYIDDFYGKEKARISEASEIRDQYRKMDRFFSDSFNSYADFLKKGRDLNSELSYSNYEGVRKMWLSRYESERNRLLEPLLDSVTESNFDNFFQSQVIDLSKSEYSFWVVESIDRISVSSPTRTSDGTAVKAYGEYRLHLKGGVLGLLTKSERVTIDGTAGPNENGYLIYNRTGYQFYD